MLTFALPKGRMALDCLELFRNASLTNLKIPDNNNRELIFIDKKNNYKFLLVRPLDVGTYVEHDIADIGIIGKDTLLENNYNIYQMLDLKFGHCRLVVAAQEKNINILESSWIRVATKYPNITENYLHSLGINAQIIKLYGSIEIAPALGFCDCIVDLVSTGVTLKANGLKEIQTITSSTAQLVVSKPAIALKSKKVKNVIVKIQLELDNK